METTTDFILWLSVLEIDNHNEIRCLCTEIDKLQWKRNLLVG